MATRVIGTACASQDCGSRAENTLLCQGVVVCGMWMDEWSSVHYTVNKCT